jgi:hypothetical protein
MAALAPRLLPRAEDDRAAGRTPILQIALLLAAVLLVSLAGTIRGDANQGAVDRGIDHRCRRDAGHRAAERKPAAAIRRGHALQADLARVYLTMFLLILVLTSDIYIPISCRCCTGDAADLGLPDGAGGARLDPCGLLQRNAVRRRASAGDRDRLRDRDHRRGSLALFLARDNQAGKLALLGPAVVGMFLMGFGVGLGWAHLVTKILRLVAIRNRTRRRPQSRRCNRSAAHSARRWSA